MDNILIIHKKFEDALENAINESNLPLFAVTDIMEKVTEKLKHQMTIETFAVLQKEEKENAVSENTMES